MITTINEFRKFYEDYSDDLHKYYNEVITLLLAKFSDREKQMAELTPEKLEKELSEFRNEHGEGELRYGLTMGLNDYYEYDVPPQEAADKLYIEFAPVVKGQLGAM